MAACVCVYVRIYVCVVYLYIYVCVYGAFVHSMFLCMV